MPRGTQLDVHFISDGREGIITGLGDLGSAGLSREPLDQLYGFWERERERHQFPGPRR